MNRRVVPIVIAACLLALAATGAAAQGLADGAATKAQYDKSVERSKARKAQVAAADPARADKLAPKAVAQRTTVPAEPATAATHSAPAAAESFHDCHGAAGDV
jgi:hypothetical protein